MKKKLIQVLIAFGISSAMVRPAHAQDASAQAFAIVSALKQQQSEIAENQTKLDEKIVDLSEKIRVARIFMIRAGGKHKQLPIPKK
jgi:peptidoglycan hydrolase CwlO-like protein